MTHDKDILFKYLTGNLSTEDKVLVEQQLLNDPSLKNTLEDYQHVWDITGNLKYDDSHVDMAWSGFRQQIVKAPKSTLGFDWRKMAASVALLAAISFAVYFFFPDSKETVASTDNTLEVDLSDRTNIVLNRNSSVQYAKDFGVEKRELWLKGEAYFDVTHNNTPFIVHTEHGDIKVMGTEFTVFADANNTTVVLHSGKVEFSLNDDTRILKPGDQLVYSNEALYLKRENQRPDWDGAIRCKNMPLAYILGQISMYYGVDHSIHGRFLKDRYTVDLPTQDLKACLATLSTISDMKFTNQNGVIVIQ